MKSPSFFSFRLGIIISSVLLIAYSCNKISICCDFDGHKSRPPIVLTKAFGEDVNSYLVKEKDLANYISFKKLKGNFPLEDNELKSILPIPWNDVTCLYVLEYEKGYEILSADKRSQVPLVIDMEEQFEFPSEDSPLGFHLYSLAEDVWFSLYHSDLLDEPDSEAIDNMESSLLFWNLINADFNTIQSQSATTKANRDSIILDPEKGHWEQVGISYQDAVYDTVGHLVPTWWKQSAPFNDYCPYETPTSLSRCLAGCVAVAAAQVLYFLHFKLGVPAESPSSGYCSGYVYNNSVIQSFDSYSSSTWSSMQPSADPNGYAAMLIGDVGKRVHMRYGTNGSRAYTENLKDDVFQPCGIRCTVLNYYSGTFLKGNLENGFPVICSGSRAITDSNGEITYMGHAFIVDSYIRYRKEITLSYEWVFDDPALDPGYPIIRTTVVYESPRITLYQMNWGYGYEANFNNVWCSMNGVWQYGSRTPYIHNRKMIINYSVLSE
jgi:hypothetical protein